MRCGTQKFNPKRALQTTIQELRKMISGNVH